MKRVLLVGGVAAMTLGVSSAYATPSPSFGGCQLDGNATFKQPLTANTPTPSADTPTVPPAIPPTHNPYDIDWGPAFQYTFDGDLSNCQAGNSSGPDGSAPASGKIYAGEPITIGATKYDWPAQLGTPSGAGGCSGSATSGTSVVSWADGTVSAIDYSTSGLAAAVGLTGNFEEGALTLDSAAKNADDTPVTTKTFALRYGGDYTGGPIAFEPPDPTLCTSTGVTTAGIQGVIGHGYIQVD